MTLTLNSAAAVLSEHNLLREIINGDSWQLDTAHIDGTDTPFTNLTYDTRTVAPNTLLVCKGRFRPEFLDGTEERGLAAYVAESDLSSHTTKPGLIVNDARKALSLLAAAFYDHPERDLTVIGITGTKGKTTTAYFTQSILNTYSAGRCALFSSVDNCLDGHTYAESDLTTPESLDSFRMMRQAVDNGMKYLVMEVSSQAYKVNRVYGLTFDVAAFLNISPDHISPIEHPTLEDYLYCKRQIIANSRTLVLGSECRHIGLLREDAAMHQVPVSEFGMLDDMPRDGADDQTCAWPADGTHRAYRMRLDGNDLGEFSLDLDGDFNYKNALAAIAIAHAAGVPADCEALRALEHTKVPGRMMQYRDERTSTIAIVDYAHNYDSVVKLLDYVSTRYGERNPRITLVAGSAGNKAIDRREGIVKAAQDRISRFVFTAEDTDTEPYEDICRDMADHVTNSHVASDTIIDRTQAIASALHEAQEDKDRTDVVLVIGKGHERWIKDLNRHVPYEGDDCVVERLLQ
ncbi:UDP-N-acetylmuramoyl-L-alanyl-D-glutamate--2,6-diaminopimelate ligase [Bifidobacterium angulatum]|uniref:UDP-N-acetylmuramoyl-L-alanyl-D-glutamate--2, 6-diaminopimelate ligase n=1 Tax=Bifidobacterium angulatum TaxID=1683 RepID=UPI0005F92338|nr:UDP-N-acetylmuramoyl-L-alanyl-D-glutamate--2,6-diaminopimelate ligase [Bifidobacterium angulatum]AMK57887.1 UDP-N-acetylmuramoyl-L-alanyl-D-glutamate--2,6-diaminopimelate ligase [Bifidobacterium angulatum]